MIHSEMVLGERYQSWKQAVVVYALIAVAVALDVVNGSFFWSPMSFSFAPLFLFVGAIKFPHFVLAGLGFSLGILTDILSYAPIGLHAGLYLLTVILCRWQYRFILAQPFHIIWTFFVLYWSAFTFAVWLIMGVYFRFVFELKSSMHVLLYGALVFPAVWNLFLFLSKTNLDREEALE